MSTIRALLVVVAIVLASAVDVAAQTNDPSTTARLRVGPFRLTPFFSLKDAGIDTNVFNSDKDQQRDNTATVSFQANGWMRLGRARLITSTTVDGVYFSRFKSEQSVNGASDARIELPLNRVALFVSDSYVNTRQRPQYEIDARARRVENTVRIGSDVRVGSGTTLGLSAHHSRVLFDADAVFLGTNLREVLNRRQQGATVTIRHALTPLTRVSFLAETTRDRFEFLGTRDADSRRFGPSIEFDTSALIAGSVQVTYRQFEPRSGGVPRFGGMTASVDLASRLFGVARVAVQAARDLGYSFDPARPYYVYEGLNGSLTYNIGRSWDAGVRAGRQRLVYREMANLAVPGSHQDLLAIYGTGFGYRFGRTSRIGLAVDYYRRQGDPLARRYQAMRASTSITTGF